MSAWKIALCWNEVCRNTQKLHTHTPQTSTTSPRLPPVLWDKPMHMWCCSFLSPFHSLTATHKVQPSNTPIHKKTLGLFQGRIPYILQYCFISWPFNTCKTVLPFFFISAYPFKCVMDNFLCSAALPFSNESLVFPLWFSIAHWFLATHMSHDTRTHSTY